MNTAWRSSLLTGSLCALAAMLAACSPGSGKGYGKAGGQSSYEPVAVITPIGHVPAPDGVLWVRSGAEVVLSAKDSDGVDSAILGVTWSPVNAAAQNVRMYERGATAMSFRAPQPVDDTPLELRFSLTVRASDGQTASSEITVKVNRVPDPNDFLLSDATTTADAVNLVLVASSLTGAATFSNDVPFTISVQKQVRYKRAIDVGAHPSASPAANDPLYCQSADPARTCVKIGPPLQLNGAWKASTGVVGTLRLIGTPITVMGAAYQNPRFRLRPPTLNADEVNFAVLTNGIPTNFNATGVPPEDTRRNNLLYTADIDTAEAEYLVTLTSTELGATGRRANVLVFAADSTQPTTLTYVADGLAATNADPGVTTVTGTLALNAIKTGSAVVESRDSALAYYSAIDPTGRRTTVDDWMNDNCLQRGLPGAPGYYGSDIHSTYLNDRDLGFGREMYFKTDCTTAQRTATGATINTTGGERASIVFNYPSLEATIKRSGSFLAVAMEYRADTAGGPKYTRFYTFAPDPRTRVWKRVTSANFDGRRERYTPGNCTVCHGGKPKANYLPAVPGGGDLGSTFIPWDANALLFADTDQSIVDDRLKPGFTRAEQLPNIQALNVQGVRPIIVSRVAETLANGEVLTRWNATLDLLDKWYSDPAGYNYVPTSWQGQSSTATPSLTSNTIYSQVIAENCRMCHMQRITDADAGGLAASSAPQFSSFADSYVNGNNLVKLKQRVFEQHIMPASRLTSDRFWITQPGATQSAAQVLAAHVGLTLPAGIPSVAAVANQPAEVDPGVSGTAVRLSGLQSRLASSYSWTLTQRPAGSNAVLVGANTAEPGFLADASGNYIANLTVTDSAGNNSTLATPITIVADRKPLGGSYAASRVSGEQLPVDLFSTGGARAGDGVNTVTILSQPPGSGATVPATCTTTCLLSFTATASGTIQYSITDGDAVAPDSVTGSITVAVSIPGGWNVNPNAPFDPSNTNYLNTYKLSCTSPCSGANLNINATTLAQNALGLTPSQFSALGYTVSAAITAAPIARGKNTSGTAQGGLPGGATANSTALTYTSPSLFVSSQGGAPVLDTFQFQITVRNSSNVAISTSQVGTVQMTVTPRTTWTTVLGYLTNAQPNSGSGYACASCHGAARDTASGRGWGSLSIDTGTTYLDLAGSGRTLCPLTAAGVDSGAAYNCVDFSNPAESLLLKKPLGDYNHGNPTYTTLTTTPVWTTTNHQTQLDAILNWIRDGAYQN